MVPNAWLTRKWCFFGHLNFIITFSMHSLKYARVIHPYEMLLKYWVVILRIKKLHQTAQLSYTHNDSQSVQVCNITKVMLYFLRDVGLFLRLMLTIVLLSQQ